MKKPIIGIVSKHYKSSLNKIRPDMYIRDEVKQAIFDNGGVAIGILLTKDEIKTTGKNWCNDLNENEYNNLITQINLCDGIIFQGGNCNDNYEMIISKYCYDNDIPTLGLCCGQNIMIWALGGTVKRVSNIEKHYNIYSKYVHKINIYKTSNLYKIIKKEEIMVNSRHKKTISKLPNNIDISAICDDGYIDAIEDKNKRFYMAFRFHPESLYKTDEDMNKIFVKFINECKAKNKQ